LSCVFDFIVARILVIVWQFRQFFLRENEPKVLEKGSLEDPSFERNPRRAPASTSAVAPAASNDGIRLPS